MRRCVLVLSVFVVGCGVGGVDAGGPGQGAADAGARDAGGDGGGVALAAAGPDLAVLGGLGVVLDGAGSEGDAFSWQQVEGEPLELTGADGARLRFELPAEAPPGALYRFRLEVTDSDTGTSDSDEVEVQVIEAEFSRFLADLGPTEGIAAGSDGLWLVTPNEAERYDAAGARTARHDLAGDPVGANLAADGRLLVALNELDRVDAVDLATGTSTTLVTGAPDANYPLPDRDGNVYVSTRVSQTVVRRAAGGDTAIFLSDPAIQNPNALAFGPEPDILYVGAADAVWRVPILADGSAGTPNRYLDTGSEVDGLVFDSANNLYVGCPNSATLYIAPYRPDGPSAPTRSFQNVGADISLFVNPVFGRGDFGATTLYYTNLGRESVGQLTVGLPALDPPLAP